MKLQRTLSLLFTVLCLLIWTLPIQNSFAQENKDKNIKKGLIPFDYMDELEAQVEVNLTDKLISLVTKSVNSKPEVVELIKMIEGIYLRTYGEYGVAESGMIKYYRDKLKADKWETLVKINDRENKRDQAEIVEISLLYDEDVAYGIFVIFATKNPDEVTLINIIGQIAPDRITELLGNLSSFGMADIDFEGSLKKGNLKTQVDLSPKWHKIQRELLGVKAEKPPIIDGQLGDKCWKTAPIADKFTNATTKELVREQTETKLVYTDKSIYLAWHLKDSKPDNIIARQTNDQIPFKDEDTVCFTIDPFHTHKSSQRTMFMVNPNGNKYLQFGTPRKNDDERVNQWKVVSKIVEDGWVVEMEIPWRILDYPESSEPINMGINFERKHKRTGEHSWWSNIGDEQNYQQDGNWKQIIPPTKFSLMQGMLDALEKDKHSVPLVLAKDKNVSKTNRDYLRFVNTSGLNPVDGILLGGGFEIGSRWNSDPFFFDRSGETIRRNVNNGTIPIDMNDDFSMRSQLGIKPFLFGSMSFATKADAPNYRLGGGVKLGKNANLTYTTQIHRLTSARDRDLLVTGSEQFLRAFIDTDFQDYYTRQGGVMALQWQNPTLKHTFGLTLLLEEHASIFRKTDSYFRIGSESYNLDRSDRANALIYDGNMHSLCLKYDFDTREDTKVRYDLRNRANNNEWYNTILIEHSNSEIGSTYDFTRFIIHLRNYHPIGENRIDTRLKIGIAATESSLPYQRQFVLGGIGTLRGYSLYEFVGNHGFLLNLEYLHNLSDGFFIVPFVDIGQAWENLEDIKNVHPMVNLGIGFQWGIFRLNFARPIEKDRGYQASFKWSRTF
ncbi:DUF4252 domain-containing protein [Candidatus Poribacteria bacterium]|nr:DUF4252 domain-containing protein [Candidatus Poribacteria bacterium]